MNHGSHRRKTGWYDKKTSAPKRTWILVSKFILMEYMGNLLSMFYFFRTTDLSKMVSPCVIVHGGAFNIPESYVKRYREGTQQAAKAGYECLIQVSLMADFNRTNFCKNKQIFSPEFIELCEIVSHISS